MHRHSNRHTDINVYLLPGLAADRRLYERMTLEVGTLHYLEWEYLPEAKTMTDYAEELIGGIKTENNVFIGSSMGGMMASEMASLRKSDRLILLSAPAAREEFSGMLKGVSAIRVAKWFKPKQLMKINRLADTFMGFRTEEDRKLFYEMLEKYGPEFLHFALNAIFDWNRSERPEDYLQVIGANDKLFKPQKMRSPILIPDAGHFMTFEQPERLSRIVNTELDRLAANITGIQEAG